ncbi:MAG: glycoside hydrolase family 9 protein, partial [Bacteroidales bacterium]|nr:glycoside hydrolase family 9 protein [Bacteroidales bacterium]
VYKNTMLSGTDNLPAHIGNRDPYKAYIKDYTWGSNSVKSAQGNMFYYLIALDIPGVDSIVCSDAAMTYIHYIHGVNPLNFVYLSNMYKFGAENGVNEFYHSWFSNGSSKWDRVGKSTYGPAPGYLTGGPNPFYDWDGCCPSGCGSASNNSICTSESVSPPKDQPQQKSYKDFNTSWPLNSWSVTENSCGYQVRYIRLLSKFVNLDLDCNGNPGGSAFIDSCGNCTGGNTGITPVLIPGDCGFPSDCTGMENGVAFIDSCGNCAGGTTGITPTLDTLLCNGRPEEFQAIFIFRDEATNEPLWSVNVLVNDLLKISDNEGKTVFTLTEGEHVIEFNKLSYKEENVTIQIHSDTLYVLFLTRTHANLKFRLHHQNTPVNNALVKIGGDSLLSNSLGIANFQQLPVPETYEYIITCDEYENQEGSIDLTKDFEVGIEMIQKPSSVLVDAVNSGMKIWPNPTAGSLYITFNKIPENVEIQISDMNGRTFIRERIDVNEKEISLDFLDKGLYMLNNVSKKENMVFLLVRN